MPGERGLMWAAAGRIAIPALGELGLEDCRPGPPTCHAQRLRERLGRAAPANVASPARYHRRRCRSRIAATASGLVTVLRDPRRGSRAKGLLTGAARNAFITEILPDLHY
jgi:hypothetical protein